MPNLNQMRVLYRMFALLIAISLPATAVAGPPEGGPPGWDKARDALEEHLPDLLDTNGVVGAGLSVSDGAPVIRVYLERENVAGVPEQVQGVAVQRVVTGPIRLLQADDPRHHRPGHGGGPPGSDDGDDDNGNDEDASGPCEVTEGELEAEDAKLGTATRNEGSRGTGTVGARVTKDGKVFALSNRHVYDGDAGDYVLVPESGATVNDMSGDDSDQILGKLCEWADTKKVDAAIAVTTEAALDNQTRSDAGSAYQPTSDIVDPVTEDHLENEVKKYGATTGRTEGYIKAINVTITVRGAGRYEEQIEIVDDLDDPSGDFSAPGDSGSLVVMGADTVASENDPVGLLFAGSSISTFANEMANVRDELGVEVDGD